MVVCVHTNCPMEMCPDACWFEISPPRYLVTGNLALAVITPLSDFVTVALAAWHAHLSHVTPLRWWHYHGKIKKRFGYRNYIPQFILSFQTYYCSTFEIQLFLTCHCRRSSCCWADSCIVVLLTRCCMTCLLYPDPTCRHL